MTNYVTTVSINYELGTVSDLQFVDESINTKGSDELAMDTIEERERREQEYPSVMPKVDESLVGFSIEVCFEYDDDSTYFAWCDNSRMVMIKWNEKKIHEGDANAKISRHKLGISKDEVDVEGYRVCWVFRWLRTPQDFFVETSGLRRTKEMMKKYGDAIRVDDR